MNAVIYARYSSHAQKDASIEQQIRECQKYAEFHGLKIVHEYCDRALTGKFDDREHFLQLIKDSAKGHWQRVLVYKMDRFARNRYDSAMYKARLIRHGVKVVSVTEQIPDGPEGILLESVLEGSAEYYSANLAQNIERGMNDNALKCLINGGGLPLGYKRGPDGRFAIDDAGASIVRDIYAMYADGKNATYIIDSLNNRGLKTSRGNKWNKNSLYTILRNERYIGVYEWKDVRIPDGVPAILSKELFDEVQVRLKKVAKAPASARTYVDYELTGKLFCGHCGNPMIGDCGTGKSGKKHYYYSCSKRKRERACDKKSVKKEWIEELVVRKVKEICLTDEVISVIVDAALSLQERERDDSVLISLKDQLSEVKKSIKNILNAIEQGIITSSTKERLEELEASRNDLEVAIELESIKKPQLTREQLTFWLERFRDGDPSDPKYRSTLIDVFINAVYVYDDHLRIVCNYTRGADTVSYDFINDVESFGDSAEVFDFDLSSSTNGGVSEHPKLYICSTAFVLFLPYSVK